MSGGELLVPLTAVPLGQDLGCCCPLPLVLVAPALCRCCRSTRAALMACDSWPPARRDASMSARVLDACRERLAVFDQYGHPHMREMRQKLYTWQLPE
jgi:hypothetical protein